MTRLSVVMTDRDVVEEFCRIVECGKVSLEQRRTPPRKNCWYWTIGNRNDVERILTMFLPRLGSRRTGKALLTLAEISKRRAECIRICERCGVQFESTRDLARFCSTPCQQADYYAKHGNVRVSERATAHA